MLDVPLLQAKLKAVPNLLSQYHSLGRVFFDGTFSRKEPDWSADICNTFHENDVLPLKDSVYISGKGAAKSLWYRLEDGSFIHSSGIQPVEHRLNAPNLEVGNSGKLVEVTVPFTHAWSSSANGKKPNQLFYYGTVHWAYGVGRDEEKNYYYAIREDRWGDVYYVDATHMHIIRDEELQPISSQNPITEKSICIHLNEQFLIANEGNKPVFMSPLASGLINSDVDLSTPRGSFVIHYKRPSRHMAHAERFGANGGELFGVPWVSYFTDTGIAFHGTYWHNDFTHPKSHGCINLPIASAKWIYLWTYPVISPGQEKLVSQNGTPVEIL